MKVFSKFVFAIVLVCSTALGLFAQGNYATPYTFARLAGPAFSALDGADGMGGAARFHTPFGTAVDINGNIYVADTYNHTIRKITPEGVVSTLAGTVGLKGSTDGMGGAARFYHPYGVAVDVNGNVYVADSGNGLVRKITAEGLVTTVAATEGDAGPQQGKSNIQQLGVGLGIAVDAIGNLYVANTYAATVRKVSVAGVVTTLAGSSGQFGWTDGNGSAARFHNPSGIAVDTDGNVYVSDRTKNTIRKITAAGDVTTLAGTAGTSGNADGTGSDARFNYCLGLAVDANGNVYVGDTGNQKIRKITTKGVVTTLAGSPATGSSDGTGVNAGFSGPAGVAVDANGTIYVADTYNDSIRKVTVEGVVTTLAGTSAGQRSGSTNGNGADARFGRVYQLAVGPSGTIYVVNDQTVRKVSVAGVVTTFAGKAGVSGSADGVGGAARFSSPIGVAVDANENVYVADSYNFTIRKVTPSGVVTTFAGSPQKIGFSDGAGSAARFTYPSRVAVDESGNVYVVDSGTIRKITPDGVVATLAGVAGVYGYTDGQGINARIGSDVGLTVDASGTVFIAQHSDQVIRKITQDGLVTTFAGRASGSADGVGDAAKFYTPYGVAVDGAGNVYVADTYNHEIRKITANRAVTTLAGVPGGSGTDEGTGPAARFNTPLAIATTSGGQVVVGDSENYRILTAAPYLTAAGTASGTAGESFSFAITCTGLIKTYDATGLPQGLSVNSLTGEISGRPLVAGTFEVILSATNVYGQTSTSDLSLSVSVGVQSITFDQPSDKILGDVPFQLGAAASSELAPTYTVVSGPATVSGSTLTITGLGTVVVRASQAGNDSFYAAESVERSFVVTAPNVTLGNLSATYDGTPKAATATTVPAGLNVDFTYNGSSSIPKNAGTYAVVGTINDGGYVGRASATLVISKSTLLIAVDAVGFIGKSALPIPLTYGSFASGDDASVLDRLPVIKTKAAINSKPGIYPVTLTGGSDNNYNIVPVSGQIRLVSYEGVYEALLKAEETGPWTGKIELTMGTGAAYTGKLWLSAEGSPLTLRGSLAFSGSSTTAAGRVQVAGRAVSGGSAPVYTVDLMLPANGALEATVWKGGDVAAVSEDGVKLLPAKRSKVKWTGAYTLLLREAAPLSDDEGPAYPRGAGYASAKVSTIGVMTVSGALADGTKFTATLNPDNATTPGYRLFVQPYSQRDGSYLSGMLRLSAHPSRAGFVYLSESSGQDVYWTKKAGTSDANYRAGFGPLGLTMNLDPWTVPSKKLTLAGSLSLSGENVFNVDYYGADRVESEAALPSGVALTKGATPAVVGPNNLAWTLKINASTGTYTGSFVLRDDIAVGDTTVAFKRTVPFAGALRQTSGGLIGAGAFLLPAFPTDATNETVSGEIQFTRP